MEWRLLLQVQIYKAQQQQHQETNRKVPPTSCILMLDQNNLKHTPTDTLRPDQLLKNALQDTCCKVKINDSFYINENS